MLSFNTQGVVFQVRAAAVIVHESHLLLHHAEGEELWVLPGGRVEPGESSQDAVCRELLEEVGVQAECQGLAFVVENFFVYNGAPNHELGLYHYAALPMDAPLLDKSRTHVGVERHIALVYRWFPLKELSTLELHPAFLRSARLEPTLSPAHVVQNERHHVPATAAAHGDA